MCVSFELAPLCNFTLLLATLKVFENLLEAIFTAFPAPPLHS